MLFVAMPLAPVTAHAGRATADRQSPFAACQESAPQISKDSELRLQCTQANFNSVAASIVPQLAQEGATILRVTDIVQAKQGRSELLAKELRNEVKTQLQLAENRYMRLAACARSLDNETTCGLEFHAELESLNLQWPSLRRELALMSPPMIDPNAANNKRSWYNPDPHHPFANSAALKPLTHEEIQTTELAFFDALTDQVPSLRKRAQGIRSRKEAIALNVEESVAVNHAMIRIRNQARQRYLSMVSKNALLLYVDDRSKSTFSFSDLAAPADRLVKEIQAETVRLKVDDESGPIDELVEYRGALESVLQRNPELCATAADLWARTSSSKANRQLLITGTQVVVAIAAMSACGTLIGCGATAAAISTTDYLVARHDSLATLKKGVATSVLANGADSTALVRADQAQRNEGLILALGGPSVLTVGGQLLQKSAARAETTSAQAASATTVARTRQKTLPALSNPILQRFYAPLLGQHVGREKEILEEAIQKLTDRGLSPAKIETTLREKVSQCAR